MADQIRAYRKTRRAEQEADTVRRITLAAVELHGSVGPSQTSMSAIAALAGVRRSTLYRHFPDEAAVFQACSSHFLAEHPLPDLALWAAIADPDKRLAVGLSELYARYGRTEQMMSNLLRDESTVDIVRQRLGAYRGYLTAAQATLLRGRRERGAAGRRVEAAIGHALAFSTWRSLAREQRLSDGDAVALMCKLVKAAGRPARRR